LLYLVISPLIFLDILLKKSSISKAKNQYRKKQGQNMRDEIYYKLRDILDTIPNGFPETADGTEIKILKKIFSEEEAEITTRLKLTWETPETIANRTGMEKDFLTEKLKEMQGKGQIMGANINGVQIYKLIPYVFGIYEFQVGRMDREFVELNEKYAKEAFANNLGSFNPPLLKVVPIEEDIPSGSVIEPYESITKLINSANAWAVGDCICKKEKRMLDQGCDNPMEVCMALAPIENYFDDYFWGRPISKDEALKVLETAEEAGLVHMTSNEQSGHFYICNCCGCCCGILRGMNEYDYDNAVARSNYIAVIDEDSCTSCEICMERCQVRAIDMGDAARVNDRCIGCGLCISTCPTDAIALQRRPDEDIASVPVDSREWMKLKDAARDGKGEYKKLI